MPCSCKSRIVDSPVATISASISSWVAATTSSIRAGWMRPSSSSRTSASRATSRRTGSKPDTSTASGVSSTMTSTPVAASNARMLRPSRPITLPFMSSDASGTAATVCSMVAVAASRWMALSTTWVASRWAVCLARSRASLTAPAASSLASRVISATSSRRACSRPMPAARSSLPRCSSTKRSSRAVSSSSLDCSASTSRSRPASSCWRRPTVAASAWTCSRRVSASVRRRSAAPASASTASAAWSTAASRATSVLVLPSTRARAASSLARAFWWRSRDLGGLLVQPGAALADLVARRRQVGPRGVGVGAEPLGVGVGHGRRLLRPGAWRRRSARSRSRPGPRARRRTRPPARARRPGRSGRGRAGSWGGGVLNGASAPSPCGPERSAADPGQAGSYRSHRPAALGREPISSDNVGAPRALSPSAVGAEAPDLPKQAAV